MKCGGFVFLVLVCSGCATYMPNPPCPPPPSARCPTSESYSMCSPTICPIEPSETDELTLYDLVDIALLNSPKTREKWYGAKIAAAELGTARGAFLPTVDFVGNWLRNQFSTVDLGIPFANDMKQVGFGFQANFLLLDFGGRTARLEMAIAALEQANWIYNWEIQGVLIQTIKAYYDYINAQAILEADLASMEDYKRTMRAATGLTEVGLSSISDLLQAETQFLQSVIEVERSQGAVQVAGANLAKALNISADKELNVRPMPDKVPMQTIEQSMKQLMELAKVQRDDLKATRAAVVRSRSNIRSVRADLLPTVNTLVNGKLVSLDNMRFLENYTVGFDLKVPLFQAFEAINNLRKAQSELLESQAGLDDKELDAFVAVVTDYYDFIANGEILKYSEQHVETATRGQRAALANYRLGIIDVTALTVANNQLNQARKQLADAKTNYLTSIANLAYHTGGLTYKAVDENRPDVSVD
ncbi:MAG: TolC family protein [Chlamydiales bacterium]|nr:TolC family protein [Chlamydiales bacterium]